MMNVLVVEDDEKLHQFYIDVLSGINKNINVLTAQTGEEALKILEENKINGIFIDLQLPRMHGFTLANKIRSIERYYYLPIVFATGSDFDTPETYKKHRNIDYVLKPFSRDAFAETALRLFIEMEVYKTVSHKVEERELYFHHDNGVARIKYSDILYASTTKKRKIKLVTFEQEYIKSNITFNNFITYIGDEMFVKCNKSYAVNILNIKEIKPVSHKTWDIIIHDIPETVCQLSQMYKKGVDSLFKKHLSNVERKAQ